MYIETTRLGEIEIDESRKVFFPQGLLGFPEHKDFVIIDHKPGSPFCWLQSITDPELAFVMTNPFLLKDNYLQDLSNEEKSIFKSDNGTETIIFVIVSIPPGKAGEATVNFMGPIVIDPKSRDARQVILANSSYSHHHPLSAP